MSDHLHTRTAASRRARRAVLLAAATVAASAVAAPAWAALSEPPQLPHSIISFPQRDFVSTSGFANGQSVIVEVWRNGHLLATSTSIPAADDPKTAGFDGLAEVNHPGGGCWVGSTPDILPGDQIRTTVAGTAVQDQTTTSNVTATAATSPGAGTIVVHGTAVAPGGGQIPIAQIDQRIVANQQAFDANGRRTLRAAVGGDGTLNYDSPTSTNWTATYTGLTAADVARALGAETRVLWLGADPAAGAELTIFETSADPVADALVGGPSPPCSAPAATTAILRLDRSTVNLANVGSDIVVDGVSTPDITDVQVHVDGQPVRSVVPTAAGAAGTWTARIPAADLQSLAQGGFTLTTHYVSNAGIAPPDENRLLTKDTVAPPAPIATPGAGRYPSTQVVTVGDAERGTSVFYSNDGGDPTPLSLPFTTPLVLTASQTIKAIAVDPAGNPSPVATFPFVIGSVGVLGNVLGGVAPGGLPRPAATATARAVTGLTVNARIARATLRARGLRVTMRLASTAHVVRIRVYRAGRSGTRTGSPLLTTFRVPAGPGVLRVTLRSRSLLARMRPGRYVVEVAAGDSRSLLQTAVTRLVTVTR